ncbi:MAG: DUF1501 domain-containing protein [Bacteroidetes bacterium]|nr:MAG: DUF1501 domain-containing protein [Bacteroidota bacterium]
MRRRDFLKGILPMALAPVALNGLPVRVMGRSLMTSSFTCDDINDRILVLIQLHGGNDGLNTLVPINQYDTYKGLRPLIGIKDTGPRQYIQLDSTLPLDDQVGLHPDLLGMKSLYDSGYMHIVQDVSYPHNNGSHFRGTDIWLSGKDGDTMPDRPESGWWGRYLDHRFPGYPDLYPNPAMPDPPGLEFGSHIISLGFHRQTGIPMGLTLSNDPSDFNSLLAGVGGALPEDFPNSDYGQELAYLVEMERSTNLYAQRLTDLFNAGTNDPSVVYPTVYHTPTQHNFRNGLAPQLRTVARLISGGSRTKVFLVRMTGFDTHAGQALAGKPSYGAHGSLLYHLSEAVKAFLDDLTAQGLADRVLLTTFSEFGRQVGENSTLGTDHGTSAPMFLFGKGVKPGLSGTNPNLSNLHNNNFTSFQHDYRQVFTTLLQDWFGANNGSLDHAEFYQFSNQKLDLIDSQHVEANGTVLNYVADTSCDSTPDLPALPATSIRSEQIELAKLEMYPNPSPDQVHLSLDWPRLQPAELRLYSPDGKLVQRHEWRLFAGANQLNLSLADLPAGTYMVQILTGAGSRFGRQVAAHGRLVKS